jgi:ubiquinone/menaquinone biosynthesis C-methylase UbiE
LKKDFVADLQCVACGKSEWRLSIATEDEREVREGVLTCGGCGAEHRITRGVADFLDASDEALEREVKGWIELAGPLGDHLVPTMAALPYYPHDPWPQLAPDFFQIFEHFDFTGKRVVDIGAGRSWSSRFIATMGRASQVVALDVLTTPYLGLETADFYFREDGTFFERIRGDVHRMPLRDGWADAVFSCATLHHSSDLETLFRQVWRVLRPGGVLLFISEPCKKASIEETQPQNAETAHGINEHIYSFAEYATPLRKAGFRFRRLVPRSIRYRLVYPDSEFQGGIPKSLLPFTRTDRGRDALERLVGSRLLGPILYRYWSLPLTVLARKT